MDAAPQSPVDRAEAFNAAFPLPLKVNVLPRWDARVVDAGRQIYVLCAPFVYNSPSLGRIEFMPGFETDLASVPRLAKWFIDDDDPDIAYPAVVHDLLYQFRGQVAGLDLERCQADEILREAMQVIGASVFKTAVAYGAVRLGGWHAWIEE